VPSDLETRLLAAIPPEMPRLAVTSRFRRPVVWAGAAVGLAAACVLAVLIWPEPPSKISSPRLVVNPEKKQQSVGSIKISPWVEARRSLDEAERPMFTWPIQEKTPLMVSITIPADLLE